MFALPAEYLDRLLLTQPKIRLLEALWVLVPNGSYAASSHSHMGVKYESYRAEETVVVTAESSISADVDIRRAVTLALPSTGVIAL